MMSLKMYVGIVLTVLFLWVIFLFSRKEEVEQRDARSPQLDRVDPVVFPTNKKIEMALAYELISQLEEQFRRDGGSEEITLLESEFSPIYSSFFVSKVDSEAEVDRVLREFQIRLSEEDRIYVFVVLENKPAPKKIGSKAYWITPTRIQDAPLF